MKKIKSFLASLRYWIFAQLIEREIYNKIFPHALCEADHGYPFNSREELRKLCDNMKPAASSFLSDIERDIARMPQGFGEAFRFILYRDLKMRSNDMPKDRMRMYRMLARQSMQPEACDPKFIARRAPIAA